MVDEDGLSEVSAPYDRLIRGESKRIVYNFCTLCSLLEGKKMSIGSIFLILSDDKNYQKLFMKMFSEDNVKECLKNFVLIEPSVLNNKYIRTLIKTWRMN